MLAQTDLFDLCPQIQDKRLICLSQEKKQSKEQKCSWTLFKEIIKVKQENGKNSAF